MSAGRGFHFLPAGLAVEVGFVALLHAQLADDVGATVVGGVVGVFQRLFLALVDAAYVADDMAGRVLHGIGAEQPRLDVHAREAVALRGKARDLVIGQARADGQGVEAAGVIHQALELAPVARRDLDDLGQAVDGLFKVARARGHDLQRIGRVVGGQHHAVAVQDLAPVGHDGHHGRAVAFGALGQLLMALHLQHQQARHHQPEGQQHHHAHHPCAQPESLQLGFCIADFHHASSLTGDGSRHCPAGGAEAPAAGR